MIETIFPKGMGGMSSGLDPQSIGFCWFFLNLMSLGDSTHSSDKPPDSVG